MSTTTQTFKTPVGWNLDDVINHAVNLKETAEQMAKLPSIKAMKQAEDLYCTQDLLFIPTKSVKENARTWEIKLPDTTGRKVRFGVTLLMTESMDDDEFFRVSFPVYVSRLRRLVQHRYISWSSGIPVVGGAVTFFSHLLRKERGVLYPSFDYDASELQKYTKSI